MNNSIATSLLSKARECYQRHEYSNAEVLINEIANDNNPSEIAKEIRGEGYFMLGNIFHLRGEIGKAIKALETSLSVHPQNTEASIALSVILNDIGQYDRAKGVFQRADQRIKTESSRVATNDQHINKKFSQKHFELAEMYLSYQRFDEAIFEFTKSSQLDPENLESRLKLAKAYSKKGFSEKSINELQKLKNEYPNYLPGRTALGVLFYGQGKVLEAQAEWHKVLSIDSSNREAKMYLSLSKTATETVVSL